MKVLVTGATGFVGKRMVQALLDRGDEVRVTSRNAASARRSFGGKVEAFAWQPHLVPCPFDALLGVDAVIHLLGEPVVGRWTDAKKNAIRDSRSLGTRLLTDGIALLPEGARPKVLVSASAVGYYGDRGDEELSEDASPGEDFLARVCVDWEREVQRVKDLGVRPAMLRFGMVLGSDGGPVKAMRIPFKLGLGGRIGSGKQWVSWVHVDDAVGLALHAIDVETVEGPVNTCPRPVTNADFTRAMGAAVSRPTLFPVPAFAAKLAFGELSALFLYSQRTRADVATRTGYAYRHDEIGPALAACMR